MIPRHISSRLLHSFSQYPVMTLTGPRQSGKTTLVKKLFSDMPYVNLERILDREFAKNEPENFLGQFPDGAIIDEAQRVPELLSNIQVIVDNDGRDSLFILTGSHNPKLMKYASQSLAGRTALPKLLPLSLGELQGQYSFSFSEQLLKGFYPRIIVKNLSPADYYANYVETYIERDVGDIIQIKNKSLFIKFMRLAAGRIGQILNKDDLARDIGISPSTVEEWLSILESTFVIHRLHPWYKNIGKRIIKSPKLYFYDVGLATYLIGITDTSQIMAHPLRGNLFENFQIMEVIKWKLNTGENINISYIRDSKGREVDLLIEWGNDFLPIEIKSASRYDSSFLKGFSLLDDAKLSMPWGKFIVWGLDDNQKRTGFEILGWKNITQALEGIIKNVSDSKP